MPEQSIHRLPEEFGGNEWLVDELYERYQADKNSVDTKWWPLFESFEADEAAGNGRHTAANSTPITAQIPVVPIPAAAQAPVAAPVAPAEVASTPVTGTTPAPAAAAPAAPAVAPK
ncbi:MAG: hypothetical protein WBX27_15145, partial [Specibacter sp.]